jgi:hypothetical protein
MCTMRADRCLSGLRVRLPADLHRQLHVRHLLERHLPSGLRLNAVTKAILRIEDPVARCDQALGLRRHPTQRQFGVGTLRMLRTQRRSWPH